MVERRRLPYDPDFSTDVAGWAVNHIKANYWRFAGYLEFEDLLQEARFQFHRLCLRYPLVRDRPHMVRLFQRTFITRLHDLARQCGKLRQVGALAVEMTDDAEPGARYLTDEPRFDDAGLGLLEQELALLIRECRGDLRLLCRHLRVPLFRVRRFFNSLDATHPLRVSLTTTNPDRVYLCEEG